MLERRIDNVVYRMGFVNSRAQGRHFIGHNHFLVNGRKVNISSYLIKIGDVIEVREKSRKVQAIGDSLDIVVRRGIPQWLDLERESFRGIVKSFPTREDITTPIQEQLIVELYSK
jgi:small subunit ribosomal protein S4